MFLNVMSSVAVAMGNVGPNGAANQKARYCGPANRRSRLNKSNRLVLTDKS